MIAEPLIAHRGGSLLRPENTLTAMTLTRDRASPVGDGGGRFDHR
ncbi:MAG: hypothetical protein WED11_08450 [Natronospirillum sp.]